MQHALFRLLQRWHKGLDSSGIVGTILMDLYKAYDCLLHDLITSKLETYGLDTNSLRLFLITWAAENKELKWDSLTVIGILLGFLQDQYYVRYYLMYSQTIYFSLLKNPKQTILSMIILCIHVTEIYCALKKILHLILKLFYFGLGQIQ